MIGAPCGAIGRIVIPIPGNVAENYNAIVFAYRNKMDVALSIAANSSTRIARLRRPAARPPEPRDPADRLDPPADRARHALRLCCDLRVHIARRGDELARGNPALSRCT